MISPVRNDFNLSNLETRRPKGIGVSPYPLWSLVRYIFNSLFNGFFSYINPDHSKMKLLAKERVTSHPVGRSLKIVFLGDVMVSKSGKPPHLDYNLRQLLRSADIIVANVESPVVGADKVTKRGLSLNFEMNNSFLSTLHSVNQTAQWVFSIANNHAFDNSRKDSTDTSGVEATIHHIRTAIPRAEIIGAEIGAAKSVLSLQVENGPKLGIVSWTEVMNHDAQHYKKKIIRETDLTDEVVAQVKSEHQVLIGFAHGNEEQSYYPLKETRDRWVRLINERQFDLIVGHGPHVLHPAEQVDQGLLFHSIGNFCSPVGRTQTKVGCIPEITIHYQDEQVLSKDYKIHLLQQENESLSIIPNLNQIYPSIRERLKKIWKTFF